MATSAVDRPVRSRSPLPLTLLGLFIAWDLIAVLLDQRISVDPDSFIHHTLDLVAVLGQGWFEALPEQLRRVKGPVVHLLSLPFLLLFNDVQMLRLTGVAARAVLLWQCFALGSRLCGQRTGGLMALALAGASPMLFGWARLDYHEAVLAPFILAVVQVLPRLSLDRLGHSLGLALLLAATLQVKNSALVYLVFPLIWLIYHTIKYNIRFIYYLRCALFSSVFILPWVLLNRREIEENLVFSTSRAEPLTERLWAYLGLPGVLPLLVLALVGLVLLGRRAGGAAQRDELFLVGGSLLVPLALLVGLFDGWSRYLVPVLPLCAVLGGAGLARLLARLSSRVRPAVLGGILVTLAAIHAGLNLFEQPGPVRREHAAGLVGLDPRPYNGYPLAIRALTSQGPGPGVLIVHDSMEAWAMTEGLITTRRIWQHRGLDPRSMGLAEARCHLASGGQVPVLLVRRHAELPGLSELPRLFDLARAENETDRQVVREELDRFQWLLDTRRKTLKTTRNPDGLVFEALLARAP